MTDRYINDQWVPHDTLSMGRAGDAVARMALEVQLPFTIGVTGKWGCGKTSVMRQAFATLGGQPISQSTPLGSDKLESDQNTELLHQNRKDQSAWEGLHDIAKQSLCIWYSPWQHQDAANPLIPLLQEIRAQYNAKRRIIEGTKQINRQGGLAAFTLLEYVIDAALSFTTGKPIKMASGISENIRKTWNENNSEKLVQLSDGQRFHLMFEDAIENVLEDLCKVSKQKINFNQARLIIFIDDLDRCEEKIAVSLLEAIKLYLGTRRCVFILGVDDVAIGEALKRHWQGRSDDSNREYLEKLFQATLSVPQPKQADLKALIEKQLIAHDFPEDSIEAMSEDIQNLLEPNPRKVKNFLNSLGANWQMLQCDAMKNKENCRRLVMFQYLRNNHRPVWRLLERKPILLQLIHRVLAGDSSEPLTGLESTLSNDDLRMPREIISRSFAHVLKHDADDLKLHRNQSLDKAVDSALDRLDRIRSDQYFVAWFKNSVLKDETLNLMFLQISD